MRKRAAWFVWYISSLYWQASTSSGRARRCSPINGLAAHITVVFLHREIKNSILNRQPWDVMHNTCSKSIETLHCLLNCCFQHEPRLSSSIYFCFRRELQEISGRRIHSIPVFKTCQNKESNLKRWPQPVAWLLFSSTTKTTDGSDAGMAPFMSLFVLTSSVNCYAQLHPPRLSDSKQIFCVYL